LFLLTCDSIYHLWLLLCIFIVIELYPFNCIKSSLKLILWCIHKRARCMSRVGELRNFCNQSVDTTTAKESSTFRFCLATSLLTSSSACWFTNCRSWLVVRCRLCYILYWLISYQPIIDSTSLHVPFRWLMMPTAWLATRKSIQVTNSCHFLMKIDTLKDCCSHYFMCHL